MTRPSNAEAQALEQRYLDALHALTLSEVESKSGLLTRPKQQTLVQSRRALTHVQTSLLEMWLSNSQPSTPSTTDEDDPTVDHAVDDGDSEYSDVG